MIGKCYKLSKPGLGQGWAEMPSLTRECEQKFVPTFHASDTCKAIMEDATIKEAINDISHIRPEKTILSFKATIIDLFKCLEVIFNAPIIC